MPKVKLYNVAGQETGEIELFSRRIALQYSIPRILLGEESNCWYFSDSGKTAERAMLLAFGKVIPSFRFRRRAS